MEAGSTYSQRRQRKLASFHVLLLLASSHELTRFQVHICTSSFYRDYEQSNIRVLCLVVGQV